MSSSLVCYFAMFVVILTHKMIFPVKGQCTVQGCGNGDSSISFIAEIQQLFAEAIRQQQNEQLQYIHELLNASIQQMKSQQDTIATRLQAIDRRSQEQDIYIKQVLSIHELHNASFQQMKDQHAAAMRRLDVVIQLLLYHDISIKNQTQNSWNLAIGVRIPLESGVDLGDGLVLLPSVSHWIILMRRFDGSLNFSRNWNEYRNGFGDIGRGEFWLGNEKIHRLTNTVGTAYTLRIEVQLNATGGWYNADYANFSLDSESNKYALRLSGFSGNAGDSLTSSAISSYGNLGGMSFSTWDADNDRSSDHCAQSNGGGWWFNDCRYACLTCYYNNAFYWYTLRHLSSDGWGRLRAARMMIKSR